MRARRLCVAIFLSAVLLPCSSSAQSEPNLENGFKPYGTYSGSNIDTINLENGNLLLHIPMPFSYPQRGRIQPSYFLGITSKQWSKTCSGGTDCSWFPSFLFQNRPQFPATRGTGVGFDSILDLAVTRWYHSYVDQLASQFNEYGEGVSAVQTPDGSSHTMRDGPVYIANDLSGFVAVESSPDANGINQTVTLRDRAGNVYTMSSYANLSCKSSTQIDNSDPNNPDTITTTDCTQIARVTAVTDPNGNQITLGGQDTLGRSITLEGYTNKQSTTDFTHCVSPSSLPVSSAYTATYAGFNGAVNQVIVCSANLTLSTSFGVSGVAEYPGSLQPSSVSVIVSVYFVVDGSTWSFQYDGFGNVTYIGLPLGGNIQYQWQTVYLPGPNAVSRGVSQRTISDNNGNSYVWRYQYGSASYPNPYSVTMTDPLGNDTVNTFGILNGVNNDFNDVTSYFVTSTKTYQGSQDGGTLLKQEDVQYYNNGLAGNSNIANAFITQAKTTINGQTSMVTRTPDSGGYGPSLPNFGVVTSKKEYDFGTGGNAGSLLREMDTSYMWQGTSPTAQQYLTANMIDLPASVQVKDANGNICAETDNGFDDPAHLFTYQGTTFNHGAPLNPVRGNLTSVSRRLSTTACSITSSTPSVTSYTNWYDTGEVYQSIDPMNHTTTHYYDPLYYGAYPTQTCNALNQCVEGTYDRGTGLLTSFTDANGQTSTFNYDDEGRMRSAVAPADLAGRHPETDFTYPDLITFQRTQRQDSSNSIVNYTYFDGLGRTKQTRSLDPEGDDYVEPTYDGLSRVSSSPNPHRTVPSSTDGSTTTYYDALGRVVQVAPQDGTLLPAGTLVTQCQSNNICTDYSQFPAVTVTDQTGRQRRTRTDVLGRLIEVDEPSLAATAGSGSVTIGGTDGTTTTRSCHIVIDTWECTTYTFPDSGTMTITVNGHGDGVPYDSTSTASGLASALTDAINNDGSAFVYAFLSGSTVHLRARTAGSATNYSLSLSKGTYDFTLSTVSGSTLTGGNDAGTPGLTQVTLYTYDLLGNLTCAVQKGIDTSPFTGCSAAPAAWRPRSFTYDTLSRLLTSTNPESGTITYTYNNDGNMITKTDARGITINYSPSDALIDGLHRVLKKTYSNGDTPVTYTYDQGTYGIGHLSSETVGSITRSFSYDPLGRVVGQTDCLPSGCHTTSVPNNGYDLASELVSLNYPDGRNVTSSFNTAGRVTGVNLATFNGTAVNHTYYSVPQSTDPNTWGYLPPGSINRGTYGNGLAETTGFNPRLQINSITDAIGTNTLFSKSYGYYDASNHNNGNVLTITDGLNSGRNQTYTYDLLNRLATAAEADNAFNVSYNIDVWGNMQESGTSNLNPGFDTNNRMLGWSYDAVGDLLNDGLHSYTYDAERRIKTVDGTAATYTYGPSGDRVRKDTASAGSTEYIYFGGGVIAELNPSTGAWTDYIFASGKRIAKDTSSNGSGAQYYQGDHLGSTRIMTDASGTVTFSCTYAPYGEEVNCSPDNASTPYRFTGKERDPETGIDYFGARHYSSSLGRFMTPDWSEGPATVPYAHLDNPQTLNLYAYVDNNPINGVDITGHAPHEYMVGGPGWNLTSIMSDGSGTTEGSGGDFSSETVIIDQSTNTAVIINNQTGSVTVQDAVALASSGDQQGTYTGAVSATASGTTVAYQYADGRTEYVTGQGHPLRDNNPGDIGYGPFARSAGAIGEDGRVAIFSTPAAGFTALDALLSTPRYQRLTIDQAIAKFAPAFENNTARYQATVRASVGVGGQALVSSLSARQMVRLEHTIASVEGFYSSRVRIVVELPQVPDRISK